MEGKGSTLVHLLVVVLCLVAFGFSIAAERRRSVGTLFEDKQRNATYCVYESDVATGASLLVAEACLIAGATKNAYHTKYRGMIYAQNLGCETLRKGVFIAGAVFVVATMILNVYYYVYFTKATSSRASHKANRSSSTVGMTGYA
ncbi:uncharacterized protein LOC111472088 isoform X2 [Cucurbita maxima]|uniref:Uncharacterized protein LOC111472088 isoform X2 n=1 Tax=Cucurbita maxima TaxID=3661 RepID=A0A6J1IBN0_CUCMA|nr:uncharacterized protein LOC111472088 isoform X2 [Cucurbita maxima]